MIALQLNLEKINQLRAVQLDERDLILLRLELTLTTEQIGWALGVTQQRASAMITGAKRRIKKQQELGKLWT